MKADIDALMNERGLDAIFIAGGEGYSEVRDYMTNGAPITGGYVVKKYGNDPVLIVNGMETEEAKKSGYEVVSYGDIRVHELIETYDDQNMRQVMVWQRCLQAADVNSGKIGMYGRGDINAYINWVQLANETFDAYTFVGETGRTLFDMAFLTKDDDELARLQSVAERTNAVMALAWDFIAACHADDDGAVLTSAGEPVTIGDIKTLVRMELLKRGLEDTGMIFAMGRDGGFPHSRGEADMVLRTGQAIVFDLFPCEMGGGYHHDMTRTWSIGYATDDVQRAYDDVMTAFDMSLESFGLGKPTHQMQEVVLDYFESQGHPTGRSHPGAQEGYVHSLGHGIGLHIHERPRVSHTDQEDTWQVGNIVTIEPGLYYPDKGFGIRVEDTFYVNDNGELISITPFRKDLVIPLATS